MSAGAAAHTWSPADRSMISSSTSSWAGMVRARPSRTTVAVGAYPVQGVPDPELLDDANEHVDHRDAQKEHIPVSSHGEQHQGKGKK